MITSESQASLDQFSFNDYNLRNAILYPALYYIYEHKEECVSLTKAASLCHISPSYFSRSFHKIMGENYSKYMNKLKIEWSKELLLHSNLAIVEISESLVIRT